LEFLLLAGSCTKKSAVIHLGSDSKDWMNMGNERGNALKNIELRKNTYFDKRYGNFFIFQLA
jgi:hypothetical protein